MNGEAERLHGWFGNKVPASQIMKR